VSLSAELAVPIAAMAVPRPPRFRIQLELERLEKLFGGVSKTFEPGPDLIARAEAALRGGTAAVAQLGPAELKAVPYLLWSVEQARTNPLLIRTYLARAEEVWRGAVRQLWRHHVLHIAQDDSISRELGHWLEPRKQRLPERIREFSARYNLFDPEQALARLAGAALAFAPVLEEFEAIGIGPDAVRSSTLFVSLLGLIGRQLSAETGRKLPLAAIQRLTGELPGEIIAKTSCPASVRQAATRSLVEGLVRRQRRDDPDDRAPGPVLEFVTSLNGDPRFASSHWDGVIAPDVKGIVEQWLTRQTIEAFFRVIDALKNRIDRPDMWESRRKFWMSYLDHVSKAWLIVGHDAQVVARKQTSQRFGIFESGRGALPGHCGLMLQIRNLTVLEMNMNGRAIFWNCSIARMPLMFVGRYVRDEFTNSVDGKKIIGLRHLGDWQRTFSDFILQETGVLVRPR
jgi:EH_Signature domain